MKSGLLIIAICLFDCINDNLMAQKIIVKEKWINVDTKSDTLTFLTIDEHDYIQLDRGKEMRNGYLLPKGYSGLYEFKFTNDRISMRWSFSSDSKFHDYYFNRTSDKLMIGNFYNPATDSILTFTKPSRIDKK